MPAKNSSKEYIKNGYYHLYNRGVEKRNIFLDRQDYNVYLSYLNNYLSPKNDEELFKIIQNPDSSPPEKDKARKLLHLNNFSDDLLLLAYGLMQNHFHLLVKQLETHIIDSFMNSIGTRYTMYFNRKYKRVGSLYQGVYKAVIVNSDEQLMNSYFNFQDIFMIKPLKRDSHPHIQNICYKGKQSGYTPKRSSLSFLNKTPVFHINPLFNKMKEMN